MRTQHFDALKGMAIFLVLFGHIFVFALGVYVRTPWLNLLSSVHMPIFILLAGYFSAYSLDKRLSGEGGANRLHLGACKAPPFASLGIPYYLSLGKGRL